jgi:hypothetical protein
MLFSLVILSLSPYAEDWISAVPLSEAGYCQFQLKKGPQYESLIYESSLRQWYNHIRQSSPEYRRLPEDPRLGFEGDPVIVNALLERLPVLNPWESLIRPFHWVSRDRADIHSFTGRVFANNPEEWTRLSLTFSVLQDFEETGFLGLSVSLKRRKFRFQHASDQEVRRQFEAELADLLQNIKPLGRIDPEYDDLVRNFAQRRRVNLVSSRGLYSVLTFEVAPLAPTEAALQYAHEIRKRLGL